MIGYEQSFPQVPTATKAVAWSIRAAQNLDGTRRNIVHLWKVCFHPKLMLAARILIRQSTVGHRISCQFLRRCHRCRKVYSWTDCRQPIPDPEVVVLTLLALNTR